MTDEQLPPIVRGNRGVSIWFWITLAVIILAGPVIIAVPRAGSEAAPPAQWPLIIGCGVALLLGTRALLIPRLRFDLPRGEFTTRRHRYPFAAVARMEFTRQSAGLWAVLRNDQGHRIGAMSLGNSFCAPPDAAQWAALRHTLATSAAIRRTPPVPPSHGELAIGQVLQILDAQVAWCRSGKRSSSREAPHQALYRSAGSSRGKTTVDLRAHRS
ncbi:hypothetical protein [Nesterenkonia aerolata]|uniref:PH (Pleckstrin Homology) domain-containing protein n=1 Tax=Nesterenkonia aerolata TaxID=3074079 RepID=A0ABU2DTP6_9MICC|nr:hypothetical protein [Nesterenkonia sp. LY-0111]MDR8019876.1 hypothetical protein [Nesterenkonia sp. LY-0111]